MTFKYYSIQMGCDPEFFFKQDGKVIGSEKIIDRKKGFAQFIVDGVQAELNPAPQTCRAYIANEIRNCFASLKKKMGKTGGLKADFSATVEVTQEELMSLDESSRKFGCAPSKNAIETSVKMKDPSTYLTRSAGGHIHLGRLAPGETYLLDAQGRYVFPYVKVMGLTKASLALNYPERLVKILDIVLGNTCVLMDRDPGNIERRKMYGRAGEYRTPAHGLEYRTLSNFWLKAYPLMSFVMATARWGVNILANSLSTETDKSDFDYETDLISRFDQKQVQEAINNNDFDLAMKNFTILEQWIKDHPEIVNYQWPIRVDQLKAFRFFIEQGIDKWFPFDPVEHWSVLPEGHYGGWETFMADLVIPTMNKTYIPTAAPAHGRWVGYALAVAA